MALTRRTFLTRVGQAGGVSAAFLSMRALGLAPMESPVVEPIAAEPGIGNGVRVVILGGGIAGLVAAYELRALGYMCTVLEARHRPGGRNWSVRGGDKVVFTDGTTQTCSFDAGHYQNCGPARLPSTHKHMLGYCKKLGVQLEVEINTSRSAMLQHDGVNGGRSVVQRQAINDTRGHVSELLSKCIRAGALDQEITPEDNERMLAFLRTYGPLDNAGKYVGSERAGYDVPPGAGDDEGVLSKPLSMHTLLDENFWDGLLYEEVNDWQATMFQPVGGMDRIPYAFAKELGHIVQYESPVTEIRKTAKGVRVSYTQRGATKTIEADYCFCAMPFTQLRKIPHDISAPYKTVIDGCTYAGSYKLAWESRRFWEQDYNIYGGLEFVSDGCSPVWLPSWGLFSQRGVLVSGYDEASGAFEQMTLQQKYDESRRSVERLHPGHGKELEKPLYIGWRQVPFNEGSWIGSYGPGQRRGNPRDPTGRMQVSAEGNEGYETLLQPDGPIYFVGDHVSHIVGWQEGAAVSSLRAIGLLNERVKAGRLGGG